VIVVDVKSASDKLKVCVKLQLLSVVVQSLARLRLQLALFFFSIKNHQSPFICESAGFHFLVLNLSFFNLSVEPVNFYAFICRGLFHSSTLTRSLTFNILALVFSLNELISTSTLSSLSLA